MISDFFTFIADHRREILQQTYEHLWITSVALLIATLVGVSLGILLTRYRPLSRPVLGFVNIIQTVPSIALLGFMIPFFGIGVTPAIIALFLYALLPIVRNTYAGIKGVDPLVVEAARGLGLSDRQVLQQVELPLALPMIFAGLRTATVINIGVATLCALIAAGGLGEYIFRGIAVNNTNMILAGAVPASLLAIALDVLLGGLERGLQSNTVPRQLRQHGRSLFLTALVVAGLVGLAYFLFYRSEDSGRNKLVAGFNAEFMEREDGYQGLQRTYGFSMPTQEMEIGLVYQALQSRRVDVISGFSTDGRIRAYNLRVLEDDLNYFPPYYAAPLVRQATLQRYPALRPVFDQIADKISAAAMMQMNFEVDQNQRSPRAVARDFLEQQGMATVAKKRGTADLVVGSKNFTENFILAELFTMLIEANTNLTVELKQGFGGTKLLMDAIKLGDVDLYPEYTGTVLLVMLQPPPEVLDSLTGNKDRVYDFAQSEVQRRFDLTLLPPLGFNNTAALMMREAQAKRLGLTTISDLKEYVKREEE
ncbi:MAG: ABC transporter permease/substrate-binding protein [Tunicatimonas sp.]